MVKFKGKVGSPTMYTEELAKEICDKVAVSPLSLKMLCKQNPHWPKAETIHDWKAKNEQFAHMYLDAKRLQVDAWIEEVIDVAYDNAQDTIETETGTRVNHEWVARSKIKVDLMKWFATRLAPKIYGDKTEHTFSVDGLTAEQRAEIFNKIRPEEEQAIIEKVMARMKAEKEKKAKKG